MRGGMRSSIMIGGAVVATCFAVTLLEKRQSNSPEQETSPNQEAQAEFPEEMNRAKHLAEQKSLVEKRIEFSRRVARELIARRLTLFDAAAQLKDLDLHSTPLCQEFYESVFLACYPGRSEMERYCRRAMTLVEGELVVEPFKRLAVMRGLTHEFRLKYSGGPAQAPYWEPETVELR